MYNELDQVEVIKECEETRLEEEKEREEYEQATLIAA